MHANEYSHLRPTCRHTKMEHGYPHSHSPYALYTPRSRHHHPQRGSQRPIPELKPPSLRRGDRKTTPVPAAAEKINSPDPDRGGQLILTAPGPEQRTENRGVRKKKKKRETPCFTHRSNVVLVCVVLMCFKTGVL